MKVTEIFASKDDTFLMAIRASEATNCHWFDLFEIAPISYLEDNYRKENFIYYDEKVNNGNIALWWNEHLIYKLLRELLEKYPPEKKGSMRAIEIFTKLDKFEIPKVYAGREEREKFYSSLDWSYVKYLRFFIDKGICQRCGIKPLVSEINHLYPIASEKFPAYFIRNLDVDRVETLCSDCHKEFHRIFKNLDTFFG